jgi:hypothetical protein
MTRRSLVTILAEDQRQQSFAYQYLKRLGYVAHEIFREDLPIKGSGEQWVRLRYSDNVEAYRTQATSPRTGLVVMIDADTGTVAHRNQQLNVALAQVGSDLRGPDEKIAHLIPKRNIEIWILCLNARRADGQPLNEEEDYKNHAVGRKIGELIKPAAEEFFLWSRNNAEIPQHCADSIRRAIPEVKRLE